MGYGRVRQTAITATLLLLILLAVRIATNVLLPRLGLTDIPFLVTPADRFGDSLKAALAESAVTSPLRHDPRVDHWPVAIQEWVFADYTPETGGLTHHLPPLSTLLMMGMAGLFFLVPPAGVIGILGTCYAAGSVGLARAIKHLSQEKVALPVFVMLFLTYPALFMLDRGNLHSGFTSLLIVLYIATASFRRWRALGWVALAVAANIRPNVALLALLELARDRTWRDLIRPYAVMTITGLVVGLVSLWIASAIDPSYSLTVFVDRLGWYQRDYVEGWRGMGWNLSLQNLPKLANDLRGSLTLYDPLVARAITASGVGLTLFFAALRWTGRTTQAQWVFVLTTIVTIFTPVLGEYHALIFIGPLLLLLLNQAQTLEPQRLWRGGALLLALQIASLAAVLWPVTPIVVALGLAFPLLAASQAGPETDRCDYVLTLASLAALAPLGSETSQGLALALVLGSTLVWLAGHVSQAVRVPASACAA